MRAWVLAAGLAPLSGCPVPPEHDHLEPWIDAGPPPVDCSQRISTGDRLVVGRCPDRASLRIATTDGTTVLDGLGPALVIDGATIEANDWPVILWTTRDDRATVGYSGHAIAPDVILRVEARGDCVYGLSEVSLGRATLDRFDVLRQQGADAGARGVGPWTIDGDGRVGPTAPAEAWPGVRIFAGPGDTLALAAVDPNRPLESAIEAVPAPGDVRIRASVPGPLETGPERGPFVEWVVCAADHPWDAFAAIERQVTGAPSPTVRPYHPRLSTTHALDPSRPQALDAALARVMAAAEFGHLWLAGDWAADRVDWTLHDPIADVPARVAPASAGLIWPLLSVPPRAALLLDHPDWFAADCVGDCPRLDPRVPAVREHLARLYLRLLETGFEVRLTGVDHLAPADLRALLAALIVGDAPAPTLVPPERRAFPPVEWGLSPAIPLTAAPPAVTAVRLASLGRLDAHVRIEAAVAEPPADDAAAVRTALALALVGGHGAVPPVESAEATAAIDALTAYWRAGHSAATARPLPLRWFPPDGPPSPAPPDWRAPRALVLFNWSEAPRRVESPADLAPDLIGAPRLFQPGAPPLGEADAVEIPPGDVVVWATVDDGPPAE